MRVYVVPAIAAVSLGLAACDRSEPDSFATQSVEAEDPALEAALGSEPGDESEAGGEPSEAGEGGQTE